VTNSPTVVPTGGTVMLALARGEAVAVTAAPSR
jgi:hypothetical protein